MAEPTNKVVRKGQILDAMSQGAGIDQKQADDALKSALDYITSSLVDNKTVTLTGFGSFKPTVRAERTINLPESFRGDGSPKTKVVPEHRRVSFKPGKTLADAVR